jgi:branched-chain amino acid transport system substrate-binding protein
MVQKRLSRRTVLESIGAAGALSLAGCTGVGGGSGATIGLANSETGSLSTFGQRNVRGKEIALADVNETGVLGGDLEIVVEDTESDSGAGVSAAQKLVNQDGVPLIIGAVSSSVSLSIHKSVTQGTDVTQISQNSTSPDLSNFPDLLRMSPTGAAQASALADIVADDGQGRVAVTHLTNAYGKGVADAFVEAFSGESKLFPHDQEKSSYSNVITSMADYDADAWLFVTYQPEFTTMAQEAYDGGHTEEVAIYGSDSVKGPKVLEQTPEGSLEGMKLVAPSAALDQDNYQSFAETFRADYDTDPTAWSASAYDAIVTAAIAIEAAGSTDPADIKAEARAVTGPEGTEVFSFAEAVEALGDDGSGSDVNYQGVSGPIDLDENGDPKAYEQIFEVQDGEYVSQGFIAGE